MDDNLFRAILILASFGAIGVVSALGRREARPSRPAKLVPLEDGRRSREGPRRRRARRRGAGLHLVR